MLPRPSLSILALTLLTLLTSLTHSHIVITYPGWRGDNLHTNGTVEESDGLVASYLGDQATPDQQIYPYGMQWSYPCGGMPTSRNRTLWPVQGGAVALQPGWFQGHATAFFYMNLGLGTTPPNMSHVMVPAFQIIGPTSQPYPGTNSPTSFKHPLALTNTIVHRLLLPPPSAPPHQHHGECRRQRHDPSDRDGRPRRRPLQLRRHHVREPGRRARGQLLQLLQLDRHRLRARLHDQRARQFGRATKYAIQCADGADGGGVGGLDVDVLREERGSGFVYRD